MPATAVSFEAKLLVFVLCLVASLLGWSISARIFLSLALLVLFAVSTGSARRALPYLVFYLLMCADILLYSYLHIIVLPLSTAICWHMVLYYFVLMGMLMVLTSPPGLISAALCRLHVPKGCILGILVALRFVPTFQAQWRNCRDSMGKRGITRPGFILTHPYECYEYVLVPMTLGLIRSADQLSASAVTRAAEAPFARSSYYSPCFTRKDALVLLGLLAALGVAAALSWFPLIGGGGVL